VPPTGPQNGAPMWNREMPEIVMINENSALFLNFAEKLICSESVNTLIIASPHSSSKMNVAAIAPRIGGNFFAIAEKKESPLRSYVITSYYAEANPAGASIKKLPLTAADNRHLAALMRSGSFIGANQRPGARYKPVTPLRKKSAPQLSF
jgi:hypothetical protein